MVTKIKISITTKKSMKYKRSQQEKKEGAKKTYRKQQNDNSKSFTISNYFKCK